jgi:hypothetical protein
MELKAVFIRIVKCIYPDNGTLVRHCDPAEQRGAGERRRQAKALATHAVQRSRDESNNVELPMQAKWNP